MTRLERMIRNIPFSRWIAARLKKIVLPGFNGLSLYETIKFFRAQVRRVGINDRARSISFSFLMAIPAATIFLCTLIPYLPVSRKISNQLLLLTRDITPNPTSYKVVHDFLNDFLSKPRGGLLSLGFVLALFYASNAIMGLMRSFNRSLTQQTKRNFLQTRWMAIRLTVLLIVMVMATVILLVTQDELLRVVFREFQIRDRSMRSAFKLIRWVVIIPLFYFSIAFIYKYAPAVRDRWKLSSPGTILATTLLILTTFVFSYWVNKFGTYNKVYGSIGSILILMFVIYLNSLILLVGFELNVSIRQKSPGQSLPIPA